MATPRPGPPHGFGEQYRLIHPAEFRYVFERANKHNTSYLTLLSRKAQGSDPRLGLVVSKKSLRKACQRNRVKRIIRESFRNRRPQMLPHDCVVLIRPGIGGLSNNMLFAELDELWKKARLCVV